MKLKKIFRQEQIVVKVSQQSAAEKNHAEAIKSTT